MHERKLNTRLRFGSDRLCETVFIDAQNTNSEERDMKLQTAILPALITLALTTAAQAKSKVDIIHDRLENAGYSKIKFKKNRVKSKSMEKNSNKWISKRLFNCKNSL